MSGIPGVVHKLFFGPSRFHVVDSRQFRYWWHRQLRVVELCKELQGVSSVENGGNRLGHAMEEVLIVRFVVGGAEVLVDHL